MAFFISNNRVFDNAIMVGWKFNHVGSRFDYLLILLLYKVKRADSNSKYFVKDSLSYLVVFEFLSLI
jgi:hypothetical protein